MPDAVCAPRVEELAAQRQELTDYRNEVAAALQRAPALPPHQHLEHVAATLEQALNSGPPTVVKDLLAGLIASIDILPEREAQPIFKLPDPSDSTTPEPHKARAYRTGVRIGLQDVEVMPLHTTPGLSCPARYCTFVSAKPRGRRAVTRCWRPSPS